MSASIKGIEKIIISIQTMKDLLNILINQIIIKGKYRKTRIEVTFVVFFVILNI